MAELTTIAHALRRARERLTAAGIEDADLEAEVLLRHVLGYDRARLLRSLTDAIDEQPAAQYEAVLQRRLAHEPTAYITGHREFYGREFNVTPEVLIPRADTETLIEAALEVARDRTTGTERVRIADIGTGSGAIAVTLALELRSAAVYATDTSAEALAVAGDNAGRLGATNVVFRQGDLLAALPEAVDVIAANLPYIPAGVIYGLEPEVREHEPRLALDGGDDGLDLIRTLLSTAAAHLRSGGAVCLEIGFDQGDSVSKLAAQAFPEAGIRVRQDLGGRDRVVVIRLRDSTGEISHRNA